jgi:hypothetical protein
MVPVMFFFTRMFFRFTIKGGEAVPEVRLTASNAGVSSLYWPAGLIVKFGRGTVVVALRSLAAYVLQAARFVLTVRALAVDGFPVSKERTSI